MKFKYRAITISGNEQVGKIEASGQEKAVELLQKHRLVIVSIDPIKEWFSFAKISSVVRRVSSKKIVMFSKELSILLSSGVSLVEALRIQYEQEESAFFKEQIFAIASMVDDGDSFSNALSHFPKTFSDFYINIVRSGEISGKMQEALLHLADYVEKNYMLASKVKNALLYPAVILIGFAGMGAAMMIFVVPQLTAIFKENEVELPLATKVLVAVSDFMSNNLVLLLVGIVAFVYIFKAYAKTKSGKEKIDTLMLTLPPFSSLLKKFYVARFSENLSILVGSGVPIIDALQISGDVAGNGVYKKVIYSSADEVRIGGSVAYAFERSDFVPTMVSKMLKIGEKTGKLDSVLRDVADFYTKEVDIAVDGLTAIIEPILIFVLGAGVAVIALAIMLPIYQMSEII
ncbi:MAG: type II secretion system F family protein [Candidatus Pacebacteria bacterium]|nr:type II secretion system F family protein [Candidatus Paceibacterota bacterium]